MATERKLCVCGCGRRVKRSDGTYATAQCAQEAQRLPHVCTTCGGPATSRHSKFCTMCKAKREEQTRLWSPRAGKPSQVVDLSQLREDLLADIAKIVKDGAPPPRKFQKQKDGVLHLIAPVDLHVGKLAWAPETGEDYDSKIAERRLHTAVETLIERVAHLPVERHLFVVGNDLLQVDSNFSMTTAGTLQDTDSRYRKMFRSSVTVMLWAIERMARVAPVDVFVVPGNHDNLATFHVGEVLAATFSHRTDVTVNPGLHPRLYYRYGQVLLGFCHGSDESHADLPLVMATERPADWAESLHREWLLGHFHKRKDTRYIAADTLNGVAVRILPSLTGTDAWHAKKGYVGNHKRSDSFVYDKREGCIATFSATVQEIA